MSKIHIGDIRPSQFMYSYGIGSIIDLPSFSVMVDGLDYWKIDENTEKIIENRLLQAVKYYEPSARHLVYPPTTPEGFEFGNPWSEGAFEGLPVSVFPRWMYCSKCRLLAPIDDELFELKKDLGRPEKNHFEHTHCLKKGKSYQAPKAIPVRFMVVCEKGHLDDFPWLEYVHQGQPCDHPLLHFYEVGLSGEARGVTVKCETCGKSRQLGDAFQKKNRDQLPLCKGTRPHLHDTDPEVCENHVRPIVLGASNSWFPVTLNVIAIPVETNRINELVEEHWGELVNVNQISDIQLFRRLGTLQNELLEYSDEKIFSVINEIKGNLESDDGTIGEPDLKRPEWNTLTNVSKTYNTNDFRLKPVEVPINLKPYIKRLVLVERLREVSALIGFTRLDSFGEVVDPDLEVTVDRVPLYRIRNDYFPANEIKGEGIFIQINEEVLGDWENLATVARREEQFYHSHKSFREAHFIAKPEENFPGIRYVLLHSLSHALMRQLSLSCGYPVASIRERIYSANGDPKGPMAGILLYTAAPDSEGTLGGLVEMGKTENFEMLMHDLFAELSHCSNDPTCAENDPSTLGQTIHAAACHACMFSPETSCEKGNKYLDRSLISETIFRSDLDFFKSHNG
jgi:hypothetical protein